MCLHFDPDERRIDSQEDEKINGMDEFLLLLFRDGLTHRPALDESDIQILKTYVRLIGPLRPRLLVLML